MERAPVSRIIDFEHKKIVNTNHLCVEPFLDLWTSRDVLIFQTELRTLARTCESRHRGLQETPPAACEKRISEIHVRRKRSFRPFTLLLNRKFFNVWV